MVSKLLFLIVFVVSYVRSDVYYKEDPSLGSYPLGPHRYYRAPIGPRQHQGYEHSPVWFPRTYGTEGNKHYFIGGRTDGVHNSRDVLRKAAHEAQNSRMKAGSGAGGSHAVSVDTKGSEDFAGHSSGRGLKAAGEAASGKVQEYGATENGAYDGFGKTGFKKGHSNSGFQKSFSKEESGKDSKFLDEDLKVGGEIFAKSYGDKFGHSGKEGHTEVVKGFGYNYTGTGSDAAKSELDSTGKHDIFYGEHGHEGRYDKEDSFISADKEGRLHDDYQNTGNTYGSRNEIKSEQDEPIYY